MGLGGFIEKRQRSPRRDPGLPIERLDGRLVVVDATRRLLASWAGGQVVSVWSLDERGAMLAEVAVLRRAIPSEASDSTRPRAAVDWLRGVLAGWSCSPG